MTSVPEPSTVAVPKPVRPGIRFLYGHPAHCIALGFGSGLSPWAPGTVGTLWGWLCFVMLAPVLDDRGWAWLIGGGLLVGWWACTLTARRLAVADPSAIVWDEVLAFWLVLWMIGPVGFWQQALAFALFRFFDAAKPGPVAWADRVFKVMRGPQVGWGQGFGILFDDLVAAGCTLLVIALWRWV